MPRGSGWVSAQRMINCMLSVLCTIYLFENDPKATEVSEAPMSFKIVLNLCFKQLGKKQLREIMTKVIRITGCKL